MDSCILSNVMRETGISEFTAPSNDKSNTSYWDSVCISDVDTKPTSKRRLHTQEENSRSIFISDIDFEPTPKRRRLTQEVITKSIWNTGTCSPSVVVSNDSHREPLFYSHKEVEPESVFTCDEDFEPECKKRSPILYALLMKDRNLNPEEQNPSPTRQVPATAPVASRSPRHGIVTQETVLSEEPVHATAPVASRSPRHNIVSQETVLSAHVAPPSPKRDLEYEVPDLIAPVASAPSPRLDAPTDPSPTWEDYVQYMETQDAGLDAEADDSAVCVATPKRDSGRRTQSSMVMQGDQIRHSCNICQNTFLTNGGLKRHIRTHNKTPKSNIIPTVNTRTSLPQDSKRFSCPLCSHTFCVKQGLQVHLVTETCRRASRLLRAVTGGWECTSCDKKFNSRNQAERHTKKSHKSGPGLSCPVCRDDYTGSKGNVLVKHVKEKHPNFFVDLGC